MKSLTPQKLNSSGHSSYSPGDELRHAAAHEGSERHQEEQATAQAGHDGTDSPFRAGNALERGIAPTLLNHHHHLPTLIVHRIRAPPESAEGHGLAQLWSPEPVRHEEPHAGGGCTEKREQRPDDPGASQTGCHLSPDRARRTQSNCSGSAGRSKGRQTTGSPQVIHSSVMGEWLLTERIFSLTGHQLPILCSKDALGRVALGSTVKLPAHYFTVFLPWGGCLSWPRQSRFGEGVTGIMWNYHSYPPQCIFFLFLCFAQIL